jgi:hypothetical protein
VNPAGIQEDSRFASGREDFGLTAKYGITSDLISDLFRDGNSEKIFEVKIWRGRLTYQLNRYLFFRGIAEHNTFRRRLRATHDQATSRSA